MIRRATFRNFKALRQVEIDFERFTVLVGPNASGKTSVLEGLRLLSLLRDERLSVRLQLEWHPKLQTRNSSDGTELHMVTQTWQYSLRFLGERGYAAQTRPIGEGEPWQTVANV